MPTYQYACRECGHRFEEVQSFTDDALTTCPECSGALRKLFGSVGIVFKGTGFYRTDSRASASASESSSSDSSDKGSSSDKSSAEKGSADKSGSAEKSAPKSESTGASKSKESSSTPAKAAS